MTKPTENTPLAEKMKWPDLSEHEVKLLISTSPDRNRNLVLQINDVKKTSELLNKSPTELLDSLYANNFVINPNKSNKSTIQLTYRQEHQSDAKNAFNLDHLKNGLGIDSLKIIEVARHAITITPLDSPHLQEWKHHFKQAEHINIDKPIWVVKEKPEAESLHLLNQTLVKDAHPFYKPNLLIDPLPLNQLSVMGYSSKSVERGFTSLEQAMAANYSADQVEKKSLSGYALPISVNKDNSISFISDVRQVSELLNYPIAKHAQWTKRSHLFDEVERNYQVAKTVEQDISRNHGRGGQENMTNHLHALEQQMRNLNQMQRNKHNLHEPFIKFSTEQPVLKYPVFDKANKKWDYYETDLKSNILKHENLTAQNYKSVLNDRMQYAMALGEKVLNSSTLSQSLMRNQEMMQAQYVAFGRHIGRKNDLESAVLSEVSNTQVVTPTPMATGATDSILTKIAALEKTELKDFFNEQLNPTTPEKSTSGNNDTRPSKEDVEKQKNELIDMAIKAEVSMKHSDAFVDAQEKKEALRSIQQYQQLPDAFITQPDVNKNLIKELYAVRQEVQFVEIPANEMNVMQAQQALRVFESAKAETVANNIQGISQAPQNAEKLQNEQLNLKQAYLYAQDDLTNALNKYEVLNKVVNTALGLPENSRQSTVIVRDEQGAPKPFQSLSSNEVNDKKNDAANEYFFVFNSGSYNRIKSMAIAEFNSTIEPAAPAYDVHASVKLSEIAQSERKIFAQGLGQIQYNKQTFAESAAPIKGMDTVEQVILLKTTLSGMADTLNRTAHAASPCYKEIVQSSLLPLAQALARHDNSDQGFPFASKPNDPSVEFMRKLGSANKDVALAGFTPTLQKPKHDDAVFPLTSNGFPPSNALLRDTVQKIQNWGKATLAELRGPEPQKSLFVNTHAVLINAAHFEQIKAFEPEQKQAQALFFAKNHVPTIPLEPNKGANPGWAVTTPLAPNFNEQPFKLQAVDLNAPKQDGVLQLKSKNYNDAITEQFAEFRKYNLVNLLGQTPSSISTLLKISDALDKPDSKHFNDLTKAEFGRALTPDDFNKITPVQPKTESTQVLRKADVAIGTAFFKDLQDQQIDDLKNKFELVIATAFLAKDVPHAYIDNKHMSPLIVSQLSPVAPEFESVKNYFQVNENEKSATFVPFDHNSQTNVLTQLANSASKQLESQAKLSADVAKHGMSVYTVNRSQNEPATYLRILPLDVAHQVTKMEAANPPPQQFFSKPVHVGVVKQSVTTDVIAVIGAAVDQKSTTVKPSVSAELKVLPTIDLQNKAVDLAPTQSKPESIVQVAADSLKSTPDEVVRYAKNNATDSTRASLVVSKDEKEPVVKIIPEYQKVDHGAWNVVPLNMKFVASLDQSQIANLISTDDTKKINQAIADVQPTATPQAPTLLNTEKLKEDFGYTSVEPAPGAFKDVVNRMQQGNAAIAAMLNIANDQIGIATNVAWKENNAIKFDAATNTMQMGVDSAGGSYTKEWAKSFDGALKQLEVATLEKSGVAVPGVLKESSSLTNAINDGYKPMTPTGKKVVELLNVMYDKERGAVSPKLMLEHLATEQASSLAKVKEVANEHFPDKSGSSDPANRYIVWQAENAKTFMHNVERVVAKTMKQDAEFIVHENTFNLAVRDSLDVFKDKMGIKPVLDLSSSFTAFSKSERKSMGLSQMDDGVKKDAAKVAESIGALPKPAADKITQALHDYKQSVGAACVVKLLNELGPTSLRDSKEFAGELAKTSIAPMVGFPTENVSMQPTKFFKNSVDHYDISHNYDMCEPTVMFSHVVQAAMDDTLKKSDNSHSFLASHKADILPSGFELTTMQNKLEEVVESYSKEANELTISVANKAEIITKTKDIKPKEDDVEFTM